MKKEIQPCIELQSLLPAHYCWREWRWPRILPRRKSTKAFLSVKPNRCIPLVLTLDSISCFSNARWEVKSHSFPLRWQATGEVVTAAPYTATAITETTQVLADGNRIVNKNSAFVARDGQGRTRREETMAKIGPLSVDSPKM